MASTTAICRIRRNLIGGRPALAIPAPVGPSPSSEDRLRWTRTILEYADEQIQSHKQNGKVCDWDLILHQDGSITNAADDSSDASTLRTLELALTPDKRYPAHYQLPNFILNHVDADEKTQRKEMFAIGCLLYELNSSKKPFHDKSDDEVQSLYNQGKLPEDVWTMPTAASILCYWCPPFAREIRGSLFQRLGQHAQKHPILFTCQTVGVLGSITACVALPILGAAGFAATGPVAGSAAAAWQASIGLVEAGSVFAWCQSAAMGGAAVGGIIATGVSGITVFAGATALQLLDSEGVNMPAAVLKEKFLGVWNQRTSRL